LPVSISWSVCLFAAGLYKTFSSEFHETLWDYVLPLWKESIKFWG